MMIPQFTFHIIILIIISLISPPLTYAQAEYEFIAQRDCASTCGTISIPFPFGMNEPHCYAHKWFEVECKLDNTSHIEKPYLKSLNLEVTLFDVNSALVEIMNPIYHSNCKKNNNNNNNKTVVINLKDSPFIYSQQYNTFLAVGCNNFAFLQSNGTTVGGCVSICEDNNNNFNLESRSCNGRYCCETSLPMHLAEYNATLQGLRKESSDHDECSYALIVSDFWFSFDGSYMTDSEIEKMNNLKNMEYAPGILEWEILNEMFVNSTFQIPSDSVCYDSKRTSLTNRTTGRRCDCPSAYNGNPYVLGGCTGFSISTFIHYYFYFIHIQYNYSSLVNI